MKFVMQYKVPEKYSDHWRLELLGDSSPEEMELVMEQAVELKESAQHKKKGQDCIPEKRMSLTMKNKEWSN